MNKRIAILVAALMLTVSLSACGKKEQTPATTANVVTGVPADKMPTKDLDAKYKGIDPEAAAKLTETTTAAPTENPTEDDETVTSVVSDSDTPAVTTAPVQTTKKPTETLVVETLPDSDFTGTPEIHNQDGRSGQQGQQGAGNALQVQNLTASAISVNCLKITWQKDPKDSAVSRNYDISYSTNAPYSENIYFVFDENNKNVAYMTGLRAGCAYNITVTPKVKEGGTTKVASASVVGYTESVTSIWDFDYEPGNTGCFAGERASGLVNEPSRSGIAGTIADPITGTGIRRNAYGDYCCAMGTWYGFVGDRFLITLDNGIQFTVQIADSKGLADDGQGKYHWFGGANNGKCIIEFVYDDRNLPGVVASSGSWSGYNWNGLNLGSNIAKIQKINYGSTVSY